MPRLSSISLTTTDPFDRLLVAHAIVEGESLVSADPALRSSNLRVVW